jgi:peptidoglycan/LPS O-acetylase OafA/YrhL
MLGVSGALFVRSQKACNWLAERKRLLVFACLGLGTGVAVLTERGATMMSTAMSTIGYTWIASFYLTMLLIAATQQGSALCRVFRVRWLTWMGTIAYGLYLFHGPLQRIAYFLFGYERPQLSAWFDLVPMTFGITLSLLAAHISWACFEGRLVRVGHTFAYSMSSQVRLACTAASCTTLLAVVPVAEESAESVRADSTVAGAS